MRPHPAWLVIVALVCGSLTLSGTAARQAQGPPRPGPKNQLSPASLGFTLEYPKKDWQSLVGVGSAIIVLTQNKREANIAVESMKLPNPVDPKDISDLTMKLEMEEWQTRKPKATGFKPLFLDSPAGHTGILIDFLQPGESGTDQVRVYAMPRGAQLYRVVCTTRQGSFEKYRSLFESIALSLTPTTP